MYVSRHMLRRDSGIDHMIDISLESTTPLVLERAAPLSEMFVLSPSVWQEEDGYHLLLRAVNRADDPTRKVARIYHGWGDDGLRFVMDAEPALAPASDQEADDAGGCEDPSVVREDGRYHVWYTGWNQTTKTGQLLQAVGAQVTQLEKRGRVLPQGMHARNIKEAEVVPCPLGGWRMFFEYASKGRSKIGLASAATLDGPWQSAADPFAARAGHFDSWHLSPGPVIHFPGEQPVMLYNGASKSAHWRIGWVAFDEGFTRVIARSASPIFVPPPPRGDETNLVFAASALQRGRSVWLYYSMSDDRPTRATLRLRRVGDYGASHAPETSEGRGSGPMRFLQSLFHASSRR
jgi:predicted GH43/DUF377 family glycosyl hydrolase